MNLTFGERRHGETVRLPAPWRQRSFPLSKGAPCRAFAQAIEHELRHDKTQAHGQNDCGRDHAIVQGRASQRRRRLLAARIVNRPELERLPHLERHPVLLDTRGSRPRSPPRC
jgi:hypothetical protein